MPSNNGKYYVKKKATNVQSKNIASFFGIRTTPKDRSVTPIAVHNENAVSAAHDDLADHGEYAVSSAHDDLTDHGENSVSPAHGENAVSSADDDLEDQGKNTVSSENREEHGVSLVSSEIREERVSNNSEESTISLTSVLGKRKIKKPDQNKTVALARNPNDLRLKSVERYENLFPDFFYSSSKEGWFCKVCTSFAPGKKNNRSFIEAPGRFSDHPSERANDHLSTNRHKTALKNKQAFDELSKRDTNVWVMLRESSLANETIRTKNSRFIIKAFFQITHLLVLKSWSHTHFSDLVQLVAACGSKEIRTHLLSCPANATYMSPEYIAKYIGIISEYVEVPLLVSLRKGHFSFYSDETSDIRSIEQFAVYATFEHNGLIKEHFIGIVPLSKLVGTTLSAPNVFQVIQDFFRNINVSFKNVRFACMDTTNVNSGEKGGLKAYIEDAVPMSVWVGCSSHKLALCFKHIIKDFPNVVEVDIFLLNLWKFFKYRTLSMHLLQECAEIYGDLESIVPVCPSTTRWTAHERACMTVFKGYQPFLQALATSFNERREGEALGLFIQASSSDTIATILMLLEVFKMIRPLVLALQSSQANICLSDIPTYVERSVCELTNYLGGQYICKYFTTKNHESMSTIAKELTLSLPATSRLRRKNDFSFETFEKDVFLPFIKKFLEELRVAFNEIQFWQCLAVFDPRKLPTTLGKLRDYGNDALLKLIDRYGKSQSSCKFGEVSIQLPDISEEEVKHEFNGFKFHMFSKRKEWESRHDILISNPTTAPEMVESLNKDRNNFTPQKLWDDLHSDSVNSTIYPNCMVLFKLLLIFPLSAACVERLFSKLKIVKNRLRNQLNQITLESLLMIATESPKEGYGDNILEHFVDELKRKNPNMRLKL